MKQPCGCKGGANPGQRGPLVGVIVQTGPPGFFAAPPTTFLQASITRAFKIGTADSPRYMGYAEGAFFRGDMGYTYIRVPQKDAQTGLKDARYGLIKVNDK